MRQVRQPSSEGGEYAALVERGVLEQQTQPGPEPEPLGTAGERNDLHVYKSTLPYLLYSEQSSS